MQVNPGEALTIRREDGQIHCITGKKSVILYIYLLDLNVGYTRDVLITKHFLKEKKTKTWIYLERCAH